MISKSVVKYIQSLGRKKFRDEYRTFIAEGFKTVNELILTNRFDCKGLYATEEHAQQFSAEVISRVPELTVCSQEELAKITQLDTSPGVLAVFAQADKNSEPGPAEGIVLALDKIRDPGNLGTIIRIADWFGVKQIVCSHGTADCYNAKVVQGSMASLGRVKIVYAELLSWLPTVSATRYAAVLEGNDVNKLKTELPAVLIIGNESRGISPELLQLCDQQITVPRIGEAESLNAAVATGILLSRMV